MHKHIKISFSSQFSQSARGGKPSSLEQAEPEVPDINLCRHISYCNLRKAKRLENEFVECYLENAKKCQTARFYGRYKDFDNGRYLGI